MLFAELHVATVSLATYKILRYCRFRDYVHIN